MLRKERNLTSLNDHRVLGEVQNRLMSLKHIQPKQQLDGFTLPLTDQLRFANWEGGTSMMVKLH